MQNQALSAWVGGGGGDGGGGKYVMQRQASYYTGNHGKVYIAHANVAVHK